MSRSQNLSVFTPRLLSGLKGVWYSLYLALSVAFLVSCRANTATPTPDVPAASGQRVMSGQPFTLHPGEIALVESEGLIVIFETVKEDSRCPAQVTCVWSGQAVISLLASRNGGAPQRLELSTLPDRGRLSWESYLVELRQLQPYPQTVDENIPTLQYEATLVVFTR